MLDYSAPMPPADSLSLANVHARSVWIDWLRDLEDEQWEAWEAAECDECGHVRVLPSGDEERCDILTDSDVMCEGELVSSEPMMSWAWPVTLHPYQGMPLHDPEPQVRGTSLVEDAAESLTHLPVCIVEHTEHGTLLALTGGGMDLSWELCEAYIRLGLAPPFALCDLPRMAGRGESAHDRHIIEACRKSCAHVMGNAESVDDHLRNLGG